MPAEKATLYIKGDRDVEVTKKDITLGDILTMECGDRTVIPKIKALKLMKVPQQGKQRFVVSVLKIISCIHEKYPNIEVQNLGEADIIITYEDQKTPAKFWHLLKAVFVALVTFCGAAFSIMAFNNDVDVTKLFAQIHELVTGQETSGFTILEIAYSFGLTVVGENTQIPADVKIGKNTAVTGKTLPEDYPGGVLESGETLDKAGVVA